MKDRDIILWKLAAIGVAAVYVYKVAKQNGGSLDNNPHGVNLNGEKVVKLAAQLVPPEYRTQAYNLGNHFLRKVIK